MKAAPIFNHVWVNASIPVSVPLFVLRAGGKLHSHTVCHFLILCLLWMYLASAEWTFSPLAGRPCLQKLQFKGVNKQRLQKQGKCTVKAEQVCFSG